MNDTSVLREKIVKLLKVNEVGKKQYLDDSDLATKPLQMLETVHFDNDLAPLSQYVANEQSCLLDDHMMTYNNSESSHTESELEDDEAAALGLLR